MALELAQVAAGFPLAASFAIAGGIAAFREGRRRATLNEAVHELRRPLQALALSLPEDSRATDPLDSSLRLAAAAVDRLECEINGRRLSSRSTPVPARPFIEAAVERWQARALRASRPLDLCWRAGSPLVRGGEIELGQAVDNMISNAFEHGRGEVTLEVRETGGSLRVAVLDSGGFVSAPRRAGRWRLRTRISGRSRHGHGLRVVRRTAGLYGGSFQLRRSRQNTEARLELPLAGEAR